MGRDYDAFLIDSALKGNSLMFTLYFVYATQQWRTMLPSIPVDTFKNLAFRL